jgi:hypothetical protein
MIVTEAELREAWRNGRGALPDFPPGARFTPAARDFLASLDCSGAQAAVAPPAPAVPAAPMGGRLELRGAGKGRLILTATDIDEILAARPEVIVVHPDVTLTDVARERLRSAGLRILPYVEGQATSPPAPVAPAGPTTAKAALPAASATPITSRAEGAALRPEGDPDALFDAAKKAVLAKLGDTADEALVDAVLRRVIAAL